FGVGTTVVGIVMVTAYETELVTTMAPGDTATLSGYELTLDGAEVVSGPNYTAERVTFALSGGGGGVRTVTSERRVFVASGMPTTEAAIVTDGFSQLYVSVGEVSSEGRVVRVWFKPFVTLIWLGAVLMAMAGVVSLTDRRLRVGVPARRRQSPAPAE
ncbi:MAG TPA: cytochrome c-type biogenesis CcmF C-terminal domain-containing protein, partial [Devosiaceae bacterium]|nr:cytochrome c-type biogenesis CcmF C-terminal domain-containing protein [Devosiaceae bacterium]